MNKKIIVFSVFILLIVTIMPSIQSNIIQTKTYNNSHNNNLVPGEFIIKLAEDGTLLDSSLNLLNEKYKVTSIEKVFKNHKDTILDNIYLFSVPENSDIVSITDDYSSHFDVVYAEANYLLESTTFPNDVNFSNQWALHNTGQNGGKIDADIDAPEAWDFETGSSDIIIAIIDTGIDYNHPDLADNIWVNVDEVPNNGIDDDSNGFVDDFYGWDFLYNDNDPLDDNGHGTHCAGISSAVGNNFVGISGLCWNSKIMAVKSSNKYGVGTLENIVKGLVYAADNGADVMSMSWGNTLYYETLKDAIDYAYSKDIVLFAAAGNKNVDIKSYPAAFDNVISVGATNNLDKRAVFSNYGDWLDVAAPGVEILSTMPTYFVFLNGLPYYFSKNYDYLEGTSMACPFVAGLAVLIKSYDADLTPHQIKNIILDATDWIDTDEYIGVGRINVYKAMILASGVTSPPNKPTITGPINGAVDIEYTYLATATDPDDENVEYLFSWGDGTYSDWIGFFASGETVSENHIWVKKGNYNIRVKARDTYGVESDWSEPINIKIPRKKEFGNPFFLKVLNQLQNLRQILGF